jgi:DNA-binding NarL/FixJ family response regulator
MNENGRFDRDQPPGDGNCLSMLTPRERKVLMMYVECQNAKRIAQRLGSRTQTVKNQLANIEHKLGVTSREELLVYVLSRMKR